jgi:alkaline phosphatase D
MSLWFGGDSVMQRRTLAALAQGLAHARAYAIAETPARWHLDGNRRAGDAIVVGDLGYIVTKSATDTLIDQGTHGWDPAEQEMQGIFFAAGPQVRHAGARIPPFDNVDVYPFLAGLLRLEHAPRTDGDPRVLGPYLRLAPSD